MRPASCRSPSAVASPCRSCGDRRERPAPAGGTPWSGKGRLEKPTPRSSEYSSRQRAFCTGNGTTGNVLRGPLLASKPGTELRRDEVPRSIDVLSGDGCVKEVRDDDERVLLVGRLQPHRPGLLLDLGPDVAIRRLLLFGRGVRPKNGQRLRPPLPRAQFPSTTRDAAATGRKREGSSRWTEGSSYRGAVRRAARRHRPIWVSELECRRAAGSS